MIYAFFSPIVFAQITSLFFMRFIESISKIILANRIQVISNNRDVASVPNVSDLITFTMCVSGKKAMAKYCTGTGRALRGKNVPLKRNIGVMNNSIG